MDRLTSMAVFVKSAEAGSLTAAARAHGLSHAMVSTHVRALEQALGVRLFDMTTRRLNLTEAGRRYLDRCVQILAEVDEAAHEASQYQSTPRGLLRVTAPATFGRLHLAPAIAEFMDLYPELAIDADFTDRFVSLVDEGFDVAVRVGRLPDSSLVVRRLGPCRMLTCAAPAYLDRSGVPRHPNDLGEHACFRLSTAATPGSWWYQGPDGEEIEVHVSGRLRANSMALLCRVAERGLGIVFGPSFILGPLVRADRLRPILSDYPSRPLDLSAVFPSNRHLSTKVRVFVDFLVQRFGATPPWDEPGCLPPERPSPSALE
jgi:DNA-binding transcriptional LysR family regulator